MWSMLINGLERMISGCFLLHTPVRKLSGEKASVPAKDCWELVPAPLPPEMLAIGLGKLGNYLIVLPCFLQFN